MTGRPWKAIAVVVVDPFAKTQTAVQKGAAIAARCGASLTLLHAFMIPQPVAIEGSVTHGRIIAAATRQRREALVRLAGQFRAGRARTRCLVRWDYPIHDAILALAKQVRPDVLICESHRHTRLGRWLLANTDWELIRDCPYPLWFVRSPTVPRSPRVLVAVDPSHARAKPTQLDDLLLDAGQTLVHQLAGNLSIVHAYEPPFIMHPSNQPGPNASERHARDFVARAVKDVLALAQAHRVNAGECFIEEGRPSAVIASVSERCAADVLVMGAVSRSLPERPAIGGTAESTIDHVGCDVFVVKPAGIAERKGRASRRPTAVRHV